MPKPMCHSLILISKTTANAKFQVSSLKAILEETSNRSGIHCIRKTACWKRDLFFGSVMGMLTKCLQRSCGKCFVFERINMAWSHKMVFAKLRALF